MEWIACSERLPDMGEWVIGQCQRAVTGTPRAMPFGTKRGAATILRLPQRTGCRSRRRRSYNRRRL
jgi:hypothetical protein